MRFALVVLLALLLAPATMAERSSAPTLKAGSSSFGQVLFDGRGYALYAFTYDRKSRSRCYGACAKAWPPYLAKKPKAGPGAKQSLLGTIRRADGSIQVTYDGRPLYYYVGDKRAGQILCQDVFEYGGRWLIVRPSGKLGR